MAQAWSRRTGIVAIAALIIVSSFAATLVALDSLWPRASLAPVVVTPPPALPPVSRSSVVVVPVTIPLSAIAEAIERAAPRDLSGQRDNPLGATLGKAEIGWTMTRGPLSVVGRADAMTFATPLNGTLRTTGALADGAGSVAGKLATALSASVGRDIQGLTSKTLDQRGDLRGTVAIASRPQLMADWRIQPNLSAQVAIADSSLSLAGVRVRVASDVKPLVDKTVNERVAALETRLRADPFIENAARREWAKMCRSVSLKATAKDAPDLWLELRPVKAFAAQPRIDDKNLTITLGVEAETRVSATQNVPNCPFPRQLALVPLDGDRLSIAVPIDMPFSEVNRLLVAELVGREFAPDGAGVTAKILAIHVTPTGDRLLVAVRLKARETKSLFALGAEANVNVWGKPVLDTARRTLHLADIAIDVDSEDAFGLMGVAARAALPYLQATLEENSTIDFAPLAADARRAIDAALADMRRTTPGADVTVAITDVRLSSIAFDSNTLRVIAEADGAAKVTFTSLMP